MRPLRERLEDVPQVGVVRWIGVRPEHGAPMRVLDEVRVLEGLGLEGDVAAKGRPFGKRQVTLVQEEHLAVIAALAGVRPAAVTPDALRRNLVVAGVNLIALGKLRFAVGDVVLVGTGACAPCSVMEVTLGPGAFQAMRGHGGITTRVEVGGVIRRGDRVRVLPPGA